MREWAYLLFRLAGSITRGLSRETIPFATLRISGWSVLGSDDWEG